MASAGAEEEVEGLDEEFLFHLNRGADLLARANPAAACASLARALDLRPKDSKALGLLGQARYKLGRFEEAAEAYGKLVNENPVEAAARVNLGLAALKAKRYPEAVKQLEVALDLNPGHRKAMGYLGLAYLETGDFPRARGWFEKAGSDQMVARCDELLALAQAPAPVEPQPEPAGDPLAAAAEATETTAPAEPAPPSRRLPPTRTLAELADSRLLMPVAVQTFALTRGLLTVAVRGEVLARARGLCAVRGAVRLGAEMKRFRGKATDKSFGEGSDRMLRASGEGALVYRAGERLLTPVELSGESGYFREDGVFGIEGELAFENGRVASRMGADLNLVHLRGKGRFLLASTGDLVALAVTSDAPLRAPVAVVAGWSGTLTPRLVPLLEGADPAEPGVPVVVELAGEGRVLLDPEGAPGAASHA